ncbi:hypothetical protein HMN09_01066700 [Mycena chlorophos]|uniref:Uncharacterized protein n=1 Tax=Mycena chlorophos TaxID=658473 RepID=A0A8H6SE21_MYCCL|nr:hypothetical protein HMN09_01066700 [Mycena chlorophos]
MAASTSSIPFKFDATSWNLGLSTDVIKILNDNFQYMLKFVDPDWENDKANFPLWEPANNAGFSDVPAETLEFLRELKIPLWKGEPSLLLHELGSYANDRVMKERIEKIFRPSDINCFVNSSGTGKTRHLLEALCLQWGFYFSFKDKILDIGPADMDSLEARIQTKTAFSDELPDEADPTFGTKVALNRKLAQDGCAHAIFARLLVFRMFLEAIVASGRSITPTDKRKWTLLQVNPNYLNCPLVPDIFDHLTGTLDAPNDLLRLQRSSFRFNGAFQGTTKTLLGSFSALLFDHYREPGKKPASQTPFYFVVDESQLASMLMRSSFRAGVRTDGKLETRSLLRELLVVLFFLIRLGPILGVIITGTGLDLDMMLESARSVVYKSSLRDGLFRTDTGGFYENSDTHARYIKKYIPPHLLAQESGQWLVKRMTTWLVGRYRTTAAMLTRLLGTGFRKPHDEMNRWITYNARVIPSDHAAVTLPDITASNDRVDDIGTLISQLHFYKIDRNVKMRDSFVRAVFESFLRSSVTSNIYGEARLWVECGFARFTDSKLKECRIFEPLIVLAAMSQMERAAAMRYSDGDPDLAESIQPGQLLMQYIESKTSEKDNKNNGYENYVALLLAQALGELTPLDDVFQFHDLPGHRPAWSKKRGRLVLLHREDGPQSAPSCYEVNWAKSRLPSGQLGHTCSTVEETLAWLDHRDPLRAAICWIRGSGT